MKLYYEFVKLYNKIRKTPLSEAYRIGLELSIEAIEGNYKPREVRNKLINLLRGEANNYNE